MKCYKLAPRNSDHPGYREVRRFLILAAPAIAGATLLRPARLLAAMDTAVTDDALDEFIATSATKAAALKMDDSEQGQDAYVAYIAEAVASVDQLSRDSLSDRSWKGFDPGVYLGEPGRNRAFFVVQFELAPAAFLPPHCHPRTSVCTLGLEGSARLRHFTTDDDAPDYRSDRSTEFLIRETRSLQLEAGRVSTLTEHRDNIHLFEASASGARGIDVTTDYGGDGSFSFLGFDHTKPEDPRRNLYLARWIGTDI